MFWKLQLKRIEDQVKIHIQLILAQNDDHIWENSYTEDIKDVTRIFDIQNQIAQSVAKEIEAFITPEEKQRIEKIPTTNLTAYDFYQRGREEFRNYIFSIYSESQINRDSRESMEIAEDLYNKALEYDSTFARAYIGLGSGIHEKEFLGILFLRKLPGFCSCPSRQRPFRMTINWLKHTLSREIIIGQKVLQNRPLKNMTKH